MQLSSSMNFDHCRLIPRSFLRKELFPDLLKSVIPECFYRWFDSAHHSETGTGPPIKTFGGDALAQILSLRSDIPQLAAGSFNYREKFLAPRSE